MMADQKDDELIKCPYCETRLNKWWFDYHVRGCRIGKKKP